MGVALSGGEPAVLRFEEEGVLVLHFGKGVAIGAPRAEVGVEQAIVELREWLACEANVVGAKAGAAEDEALVALVEGRGEEWVADGHAVVLPSAIEIVVVVVVDATHLVADLRCAIVVDRPALIICAEVFDDERRDPAIARERNLKPILTIEPTILEEERTMVFKEMIVVGTKRPSVGGTIAERGSPSTEGVARDVGIAFAIGDITSTASDEGMEEVFEAFAHLDGRGLLASPAAYVVESPSELCGHLQSADEGEPIELGMADAQIARLGVEQAFHGIGAAGCLIVALP